MTLKVKSEGAWTKFDYRIGATEVTVAEVETKVGNFQSSGYYAEARQMRLIDDKSMNARARVQPSVA